MKSGEIRGGLRRQPGFSMIEVVVAIGMVALAMVALMGVFTQVAGSSVESSERRVLLDTVDSLRSYLRDVVTENAAGFDKVRDWIDQKQELVFITYQAKEDGSPDPEGPIIVPLWGMVGASHADVGTPEDNARVGPWVRVRLMDSTLVDNANATSSSSALSTTVEMDVVPTPKTELSANPRLRSTLIITR